ncbi:WW domain-binding protein 4 isoform X2 [Hyla sarda]|uniref:WW domain-binding protein 4 isoform X2 n=1 Tax=Hyla sarda TaxID=327740 RepID=UPI0024C37D83|nr:WW domain-binding protein 4 isoform X2 [Hyla sarda]
MADYWKSQPKKFCTYCKCWIADNKPSIEFHERGKNHKENVIKKISEIKQKSMAKAKQDEKMSKEFAAMEEAALKAYEEDLKRLEGTLPVAVAPVGPSMEERKARDEQKRMEIEALEKHHTKRQWKKSLTPEGYPYFYNLLTGETQWEEPEGFHENKEEEEIKSAWIEGVSEEGYTYYYNSETGESRWDKPDNFNNLHPSDKETSKDAVEVSVADKQEEANPEGTADSSPEESQSSEDTTKNPTVAQTPKIHFKITKETKSDNDEVSDRESKPEEADDKKDASPKPCAKKSAKPKSAKPNPYGAWETIQEEEDPYENVDLELPIVEFCDPGVSLPDVEPKVKFKEKTITSLGDAVTGASVFKKRKLENVKSRNIRQRLDDQ